MTDMIAQIRGKMQDEKYQSGTRLGWLASVRMLVISIMAFGYASTMPRGMDKAEYFNMFGYDPSWIAIQVVFMISGFLALRSLQRHGSVWKMFMSRAMRNLPTLMVFVALVILVLYPVFGSPIAAGESRFGLHLEYFIKVVSCVDPGTRTPGLLDNALYMCVIQGGLWTFRWGLVAFMATGLMWVVGALRNRHFLAMMTFASVLIYVVIFMYNLNNPNAEFGKYIQAAVTALRLGWMYMVGMCMYAYRAELPRTLAIPAGFLALAGVQFFFLAWTPFIEICMDLGFGYLAFIAMTSHRKVPKRIQMLPDLSLGIYIYNWPAAQIALLVMPSITPYPLFFVSFSVTLLLSYATWLLLSRRINLSISRRMSPQLA